MHYSNMMLRDVKLSRPSSEAMCFSDCTTVLSLRLTVHIRYGYQKWCEFQVQLGPDREEKNYDFWRVGKVPADAVLKRTHFLRKY
jgi:hypothetical protein